MASGVGTSPTTAAPPHSPITHFSHPHELHPLPVNSNRALCSACRLQSSGLMYTCLSCTSSSFALHQSCADLPRHVTHPSHAACVLSLLVKSSYPGGVFSCDGCRRPGEGWSYHCARCEYDLHVTCACRPLRIKVPAHAACDLQLVFGNPYQESNGFACDVCRKIGTKQWLYRCAACEFDVHLDCAAASQNAIALLQDRHSFSPAGSHSAHSASAVGMEGVGNSLSSPAPRPALQNRHSFPAAGSQSAHNARAGGMDVNGNPLSSPAPRPGLQNRHSFPAAGSQSAHNACAGGMDVYGNPLSSPAPRPGLQNRHSFPVQGAMPDFGANPLSLAAAVRREAELVNNGSGAYGEVHQFPGWFGESTVEPVNINEEMNLENNCGGRVGSLLK